MSRRCTCWTSSASLLKREQLRANDRRSPRKQRQCRNNRELRVALPRRPPHHAEQAHRKLVAKRSLQSSIVSWLIVSLRRLRRHPRFTSRRHHARAKPARVSRRQLQRTAARRQNSSAKTTSSEQFKKAKRFTSGRARSSRLRRVTLATQRKCLQRSE